MNLSDVLITTFITNCNIFYYKVMPFKLKNAWATYQKLMDIVFSEQLGQNLEVYIDFMFVKTPDEGKHGDDLRETLASIRRYKMRLNFNKCSFGVKKWEVFRIHAN